MLITWLYPAPALIAAVLAATLLGFSLVFAAAASAAYDRMDNSQLAKTSRNVWR